MLDRVILLLIKTSERGRYEKTKHGYLFEISEAERCLIALSKECIEFKIKTVKWIPGSYEPIEGSETYKNIMYKEIETASDEEVIAMISSIIDKIVK